MTLLQCRCVRLELFLMSVWRIDSDMLFMWGFNCGMVAIGR